MKLLTLALLITVNLCTGAQDPSVLTLTQIIPLPGVKGRFDHFAIDAKGHRLFIAALGNNTLEIVDLAGGRPLKSITGLHKPTGVLFLAEKNQIAVANGDDGTLKVFDGISYGLVNTLGGLENADNLRFDPKTKRIYAGYAKGALGIVDSETMQQVGSIKLGAHPESFQLETEGPRIFVNVTDAKHIAVIDRETKSVVTTWPMTQFHAHFPMAMDQGHHRLFVGCRSPARLIIFDTANGHLVIDVALSGDTDDLFFDAKRAQIYASCGDGFVDVIKQGDADHYQVRDRIRTRPGARTSFFSPELDALYLAVPHHQDQPAELRVLRPRE